jgi:hypothetical protein
MRKFDHAQAVVAVELQQMVTDYWREIDDNNGVNATEFFTEDIVGDFGPIQFMGHEGVRQYYADRLSLIRAHQKDGIRTTRHIVQNLHIAIASNDLATLSFILVTYGGGGSPPVAAATKPVAISDTYFECRRQDDSQWRFCHFSGVPIFLGEEDFAKEAMTCS